MVRCFWTGSQVSLMCAVSSLPCPVCHRLSGKRLNPLQSSVCGGTQLHTGCCNQWPGLSVVAAPKHGGSNRTLQLMVCMIPGLFFAVWVHTKRTLYGQKWLYRPSSGLSWTLCRIVMIYVCILGIVWTWLFAILRFISVSVRGIIKFIFRVYHCVTHVSQA